MIKVLELFAGIGACSKALERLGIEHKIVDAVEIDKYAMASFNAIHGTNFEPQDITKWDKDVEVDLIMHGSPCITSDSLILTNKGYIPFEEVQIGDMVLTKSNTWQKIIKKFNNGVHKTIYLNAMGFENIHCTPEHKFYVREMYRKWNNEKRSYDRLFKKPEFIEANNLTSKHYLGVPIIQEEIPFYTNDLDFWYLIGLYLGDGWLKLGKGYDVVFGLNEKKIKKLNENVNKDKYNWTTHVERTITRLRFANKEMYEFISKYIGTGSFEKHIPYEILCLPKKQLKALYNGYLDSDGCNIKNTDRIQFSSVNRSLIYSFSLIINKLFNRPTQISLVKTKPTKNIENRLVKQHDWYLLRFTINKKKQDHAFCENNYIWYPFNKIEKGKDENVYNMEVDIDHSYIVQGCISKNCQDFSVAGKQAGGDVGSGTRSSLMYETIRIVGKLRPKYVIWENVKNLLSAKHRHNFDAYLETMKALGYTNYYQVLNAKDYGIPQNRERVFTVSIRNDIEKKYEFPAGEKNNNSINVVGNYMPSNHDASRIVDEEGIAPTVKENHGTVTAVLQRFEFPPKQKLKIRLKDILENEVDEKFYLSDTQVERMKTTNFECSKFEHRVCQEDSITPTLCARDWKDPKCVQVGTLDIKGMDCVKRVYSDEGLSPTLTDMQGGNRQPKIIVDDTQGFDGVRYYEETTPTLRAARSGLKTIDNDYRIRKLTPKECYRLMGFDDEDFEKAAKVCSNSQLYKQAGNSIVVNVLEAILKELL